jgi:LmbE family N-acetylglucosaminyl deacetylase
MQFVTWEQLTGQENLLILAPMPGDETRDCGGLIARGCRRGRPPFVVVLTDGVNAADRSREAEVRAATRLLGLTPNRLLLAGLFHDSLPTGGAAFDAIVHGIGMVMWARDCNVICAPWGSAAARIARAVSAATGVGLLFVWSEGPLGLDIAAEAGAKRAALAAYGLSADSPEHEAFLLPPPQRF